MSLPATAAPETSGSSGWAPPSVWNSLGATNVTLTPGNRYTLTLETSGYAIVGSLWSGCQVHTSLVGSVTNFDATYSSGSVGVLAWVQQPMPEVDVTFDNFGVKNCVAYGNLPPPPVVCPFPTLYATRSSNTVTVYWWDGLQAVDERFTLQQNTHLTSPCDWSETGYETIWTPSNCFHFLNLTNPPGAQYFRLQP